LLSITQYPLSSIALSITGFITPPSFAIQYLVPADRVQLVVSFAKPIAWALPMCAFVQVAIFLYKKI